VSGEASTALLTGGATCNKLLTGYTTNIGAAASGTYIVTGNDVQLALAAVTVTPLVCTITMTGTDVTPGTIVITVNISVVAQPLTTTQTTPLYFAYQTGGALPTNQSATIKLPLNAAAAAFTVDLATVPPWLTVTPAGAATPQSNGLSSYAVANPAGNLVAFSFPSAAALATLNPGTITANVHFNAFNYNTSYSFPASSQALDIQIVLNVTDSAATLSLLEGPTATVKPITWTKSTTSYPTPTVTPISSNETIPFAATCAVASVPVNNTVNTCTLTLGTTTATTVNGVAYGWGTPLAIVLNHGLFDNQLYGTVVTATVTVVGGGSTLTYAYAYTVQPTDPTLVSLSPTSVAPIVSGSLLMTLKGTNFVSQRDIYTGTAGVVPTQVYFGATLDNLNALAGASVLVIDQYTISLSVPFGEVPALNLG